MKTAVIRKEHFNAVHRLNNSNWDAPTNEEVFGKCNNANFHGHNYELHVKVIGKPDPDTGYVYDMKALSDLIKEQVTSRFDQKNLNEDVEEFQSLNPTAENIAAVIWQLLRAKIDSKYEIKITLYETERNIVEFPAG